MTSSSGSEPPWNKAERLAVAAAVAPWLRSQPVDVKARRVGRLDPDGKLVGYTTLGKVQEALLLDRDIAIEMADGVRPTEVGCLFCPKTIKVPRVGPVPQVCTGPGGCHEQRRCAGYGATEGKCKQKPSRDAFRQRTIIRRHGEPWTCKSCSRRKANSTWEAPRRPVLHVTTSGPPRRRPGPKRTGSVESFIAADGRTYFKARIRLGDGSRTRVDVPEKHSTPADGMTARERAELYAEARQEREDETGELLASKRPSRNRLSRRPPCAALPGRRESEAEG